MSAGDLDKCTCGHDRDTHEYYLTGYEEYEMGQWDECAVKDCACKKFKVDYQGDQMKSHCHSYMFCSCGRKVQYRKRRKGIIPYKGRWIARNPRNGEYFGCFKTQILAYEFQQNALMTKNSLQTSFE